MSLHHAPARSVAVLLMAACVLLGAGCAQVETAPAPSASPPATGASAPASAPVAAAPAPPPAPAPAPPPPLLPFDEALLAAADALLGRAQLPADGARYDLVIDPLIDGVTGMQSTATQAMGARIVELIRARYPQYTVQPFTLSNIEKTPLVLVGTFTGVNAERKTEGRREAYRICLALADLKSGKLVSKGLAFAQPQGVDPTPLPFYRDAPAIADDAATQGYIRTCQGTRAGDPIHPLYVDRIVAASFIAEASDAYAAGRYTEALDLYRGVLASPAGNQLRAYNGIYLANWRLGRRDEAAQAFGQVVDYGLASAQLGVKFLFRPGSTRFWAGASTPALPYATWLQQIAARASLRASCMEVVGHASVSGPEPVNERLSLLRAEAVRNELTRLSPELHKRIIASGAGSRQALVGNGRDDASDAIDRRVAFKVIGC